MAFALGLLVSLESRGSHLSGFGTGSCETEQAQIDFTHALPAVTDCTASDCSNADDGVAPSGGDCRKTLNCMAKITADIGTEAGSPPSLIRKAQ